MNLRNWKGVAALAEHATNTHRGPAKVPTGRAIGGTGMVNQNTNRNFKYHKPNRILLYHHSWLLCTPGDGGGGQTASVLSPAGPAN